MKQESIRADDARIACPLFQEEYGGSKPTSALQLRVAKCSLDLFVSLNQTWHSRLPNAGGFYVNGLFFATECNNVYYAVAAWSDPISRMLSTNDPTAYELRRFAIAPDSPKNTASRILSVMIRMIRKEKPEITRLISYQDTEVHTGTIYKASGWKAKNTSKAGDRNWIVTHKRASTSIQTDAPKIRWEYNL